MVNWIKIGWIFVCFSCLSQGSFYKVYSGNGYDRGEGGIQLSDSGYVITGTTSSFEVAPAQALLMRLDKGGNLLWSKSYGGAESESGKRVTETADGNFFVAGYSNSGLSRDFDFYFFLTTPNGTKIWDTLIDRGGWERIHDLTRDKKGSIVLVGVSKNTNTGESTGEFFVFDAQGRYRFGKSTGVSGGDVNYLGVSAYEDTSVVVVGTQFDAGCNCHKGLIQEVSENAKIIRTELFGTDGYNQFNDVIFDDNRIKALGQSLRKNKTDHDIFTVVLKKNWDLIVKDEFYTPNDDARYTQVVKCVASPQGNTFVALQRINASFPTNEDGEDVFLCRNNHELYYFNQAVSYSNVGQDEISELVPTRDGYALAVGYHTTIGSGGNSVFLVKINAETNFPSNQAPTPVNILDVENNTVSSAELLLFPNPVQAVLNIQLKREIKNLIVCDVLGKQKTVSYDSLNKTLDCSELAAGTYIVTLTTEEGMVYTVRFVKK